MKAYHRAGRYIPAEGRGLKQFEIYFEVEPVPKGRPRFTRTGHAYTPKKTADYEKQIREMYFGPCFEGPIYVKLIFNMPIPKSFSKKKREEAGCQRIQYTKKPDLDNLAKAVLDALNGVAFTDDSQIVRLGMEKRYHRLPGVWLEIWEVVT